jgi:electron transfer flavoprotein alpha subunit
MSRRRLDGGDQGAEMPASPAPERGGVLVVAEHLRGEVREVTYELVAAARELGGPVSVAAIAGDPGSLDLGRAGVDELVRVKVGSEEFDADGYRAALAELVRTRRPQVVLLGFTVNSMAFAPAVAAELGLGFASDVFALAREGEDVVATRAFYGGKVHAEVDFPGRETVVLLLRPSTWPPVEEPGSPAVVEVDVETGPSRTRHRGYVEAPRGDVDITTADFVLAIGRGIGEQENVERFERLAERLGATLGVSRPLVDSGWVSSSRQVGQSGKTVKPKVYLALGISGAVQHLAGMKSSGLIVAVNSDPEAAIFDVAHYGVVADLFDVADELDELLG